MSPPMALPTAAVSSFRRSGPGGTGGGGTNPTPPDGSAPCFLAKPYPSPVPSTPSPARTAASPQPPTQSAPTAPAMAGTATAMRTSRLRDMSGRDPAESPLPPLILEDGLEQVAPRDVGPEDRRDVELGVGELPQQKVREPVLTGRANQQVRVAPGRGVELGTDGVFVDVFEALHTLEHLLGEETGRLCQLTAR